MINDEYKISSENPQQSNQQQINQQQINQQQVMQKSESLSDPDFADSRLDSPVLADDPDFTDQQSALQLPQQARQALVSLLKFGVILATQKPKLFHIVCLYQQQLTQYLQHIYLILWVDERGGIAYIEQQAQQDTDEDDEVLQLINSRTLTLYDSFLMIILRKFYQERQALGEDHVFIDIDRIDHAMRPFLAMSNYQSHERKKLAAALEQFRLKKLLISVRGEESRFEISPIIRHVLDASVLENLLAQYEQLLASNHSAIQSDDQSQDDEDES
ncbi:DUF4194 domain-containing protein [Acinetobacter sp.]|uniref:DUF4194 domain-containing protein n=1 Tax=Acinetobacter sp. TaxID=472 RepID=UPI0035B477E6